MKCISWNVNGIRAVLKKDFIEVLGILNADVFCIQETRAQPNQIEACLGGLYPYHYINSAEKKGYSGTMILCKKKPLSVLYGIGLNEFDHEGRVITLEYPEYYIVTVYVPSSGDALQRLEYRLRWDVAFGNFVKGLDKPVIICGDFNVANNPIDITSVVYQHNAGFTPKERQSFKDNLLTDFIDTYRSLYPYRIQYTWWSYRNKERKKNFGWRLDYWLVSPELKSRIVDSKILDNIYGSDHCPIELDIQL